MPDWAHELQQALSSGAELADAGLISSEEVGVADEVRAVFTVKVPPTYLSAMREASPADPVWRTVVPSKAELTYLPEELTDPIGDETHSPLPGVTHRYPDRVLLKPVHICAVYCRFCFRRYAVGQSERALTRAQLKAACHYISEHPEIWEVILTGGDPLVMSDHRIGDIVEELRAIEHVRVIRIHTRVPTVLPSRITPALARILRGDGRPRKPVYVVLHVNHAQEITAQMEEACDMLVDNGVPLLNQSVLLAGINDGASEMEELLRRLVELRIKPYYLHHGDLARGTGHFRTDLASGRRLMRTLRGRVSGLCLPLYVLDIPGGFGKVPAGPEYAVEDAEGWVVTDNSGRRHPYPPRQVDTSQPAADDERQQDPR
jgi:lysine 2,3-aminomutase